MSSKVLKSLELFTGAGGLALGAAEAGFHHSGLFEWNSKACDSLRENSLRVECMHGWPVVEGDVRHVSFEKHLGAVSLLAAGAPCQPFSLGGKHRGDADDRNMFPEVFRAARATGPEIVVIENVKGLLRTSFRPYFDHILRQLSAPELACPRDFDWRRHDERLQRLIAKGDAGELRYNVSYQLLNAADFGVPQRRDRVFIVAFRSDLDARWVDLAPTHSEDALLYAKWVDRSYWKEHGLKRRTMVPPRLRSRVEKIERMGKPATMRWRTVRDALRGLPEPTTREHPTILSHVANPGARPYPGHTGSPWDEPAKTLKAGDHGVPGGENMLRRDNGTVRYFTVREAARLQGFPDEYRFAGAWTEGFRQLGNAVPVPLARAVVERARDIMLEAKRARSPEQRTA